MEDKFLLEKKKQFISQDCNANNIIDMYNLTLIILNLPVQLCRPERLNECCEPLLRVRLEGIHQVGGGRREENPINDVNKTVVACQVSAFNHTSVDS